MIKFPIIIALGILTLYFCNQDKSVIHTNLVIIEGGSFYQGKNQFIISPKGDIIILFTGPYRKVEISDSYISKCEKTLAQFKEFVKV